MHSPVRESQAKEDSRKAPRGGDKCLARGVSPGFETDKNRKPLKGATDHSDLKLSVR
jgi:hypothetical protein